MPSAPPTVLRIPTLGYAAILGELYDQRSGEFLGVQLYPEKEAEAKEFTTDIANTDVSLSLSTTRESKATLLDINAKLSLSILSGLINVSGSAHYVDDEKSNSTSDAYALALKMRLNEKRLLFAEDPLGYNVLKIPLDDYVGTKRATHFVSAVTYGGNYIVNLVARKSEASKEKNIEGSMHLQFDKLKGLVDLDGEAKADIKNQFNNLNDKFDLVIHGDVSLPTVPVDPKDVLDSFPKAANLIRRNGGVPISVTLQPIPPTLYKGILVHDLAAEFVDDVLAAFSKLGDLSSRFKALQSGAKVAQGYVPDLARTTSLVAAAFTEEHDKLRSALSIFLKDYLLGKKPPPDSIFSSETSRATHSSGTDKQRGSDDTVKDTDISSQEILEKIGVLYEKYLKPDSPIDSKISKLYRPSLPALEEELLRFQFFVSDLQKGGKPTKPFFLSTLQTVSKAITTQNTIPLFIMTPLIADKGTPNLAIAQYLALLRKHADAFHLPIDPVHPPAVPAYLLYAEDLGDLDRAFEPPGGKTFSALEIPALFVGTVDYSGKLTWTRVWSILGAHVLPLSVTSDNHRITRLLLSPPSLNSKDSFSFLVHASSSSTSARSRPFLHLRSSETNKPFLELWDRPFSAVLGTAKLLGGLNTPVDEEFVATFVQDTHEKKWTLYFNGGEVANQSFTGDVLDKPGPLDFSFTQEDDWWDGQISNLEVFSRALTQEEVEAGARIKRS